MIRKLILAALYIFAVHYAYVSYISPTFEYAHYTYLPPGLVELVATYFLTWLVVFAHKDTAHPSQAAAGLIYALCYVPIQLSLLFTVEREYWSIFPAQLALAFSMALIFLFAHSGPLSKPGDTTEFKSLDLKLGLLTLSSIILIVIVNRDHMRLVSFSDVYELRFESSASPSNPLINYLTMWLSYCFISYFIGRGIIHKKKLHLGLGLVGSLVLYMATGAKASLLLLPMTISVIAIWKTGPGFLSRTLLALIALISTLVIVLPDDGIFFWTKSIILVRIIGSSGWVASKYFEYFDINGFTFYNHIGPINAIFNNYPYGNYLLGQIIGIEYSGGPEANFNASFWASDGFAAAGVLGVLIITIPVIFLLYLINLFAVGFSSRFIVAWNTGFFIALLNLPLSTSLLSGGGLILLFLTWHTSRHQILLSSKKSFRNTTTRNKKKILISCNN
jgi:hypothetical protein